MSYSGEHPPTRVMHLEGSPPALALDEALQAHLTLALQRASAYLLGKQSPQGGFCFYRGYYLEELNPADTWHGLAVLRNLLHAELPQWKRHAEFVVSQTVEPQPFALYCRMRSLYALDTIHRPSPAGRSGAWIRSRAAHLPYPDRSGRTTAA
ncbi:hypothetical protein ASG87_05605 [Frateuria sp. Soil773]|nr:hypothetical protein ASG87_05605 [Frateuria sp. Soil773]